MGLALSMVKSSMSAEKGVFSHFCDCRISLSVCSRRDHGGKLSDLFCEHSLCSVGNTVG